MFTQTTYSHMYAEASAQVNDMKTAIDKMDLEECRLLSRCLRRRVGSIAASPSQEVKIKGVVGNTASVKLRGYLVTGQIEEVNGNAVMLRFKDSQTVVAMLADLVPDGFGIPATELPPLIADYCSVSDVIGLQTPLRIAIRRGHPYLMEAETGGVISGRRLLPAAAPEAIQAHELTWVLRAPAATVTERKLII